MGPLAGRANGPTTAPRVSLAKMVGQQIMSRMVGTSADSGLLARIRAGQVGGVILYADNIVSPGQTRALVHQLQSAARAGHNPPLLIATDQEGGQVKRLPWAPPAVSPPQMGIDGSSVSQRQGMRTGRALRGVGINVDLAPVVDVAHSSSSFMWQEGRAFGMSASRVIDSAVPFALGMMQARVAPTAKQFPGVGGALVDTDRVKETIRIGRRDLAPYRVLIKDRVPLIMISTGVYPALDRSGALADISRPIVTGLLREKLGYQGVVISDDLELHHSSTATAQTVVRAAAAGVDIKLVSTNEQAGLVAYHAVLDAVQKGKLARAAVEAAYARIEALKAQFA